MNKRGKPPKGRCLKGCAGRLEPVFITETYTRRGSKLSVTVTGIPAFECSVCHERLTDLETFGEVERFTSPLLELGRKRGLLPAPQVTIEFPRFSQLEQDFA
jgi:YgiT-type zinc finger domain-containing protein